MAPWFEGANGHLLQMVDKYRELPRMRAMVSAFTFWRRRPAATTLALWLAGSALFAGCGGAPCPSKPHTDAEKAIDTLRSMREPLKSIRAEATVEQWSNGDRIRGTVWMMIEKPGRVRFDAMTPIGPVAVLTSDGSEFALTDLRKKVFISGPPCAKNVSRLLGVTFSASDAARFLLGDVPTISAEKRSMMCAENGGYRAELYSPDGKTQIIELLVDRDDLQAPPEKQRMHVASSTLKSKAGKVLWRITFDDYEMVADEKREGYGFLLPHSIRVEDKAHRSEVRLRFRSIDANIDIAPGTFQQTARPGLVPRTASCESSG